MCKMKYNKEIIVSYLAKIIGVDVNVLATLKDKLIQLPIVIKDSYVYIDVEIMGIRLTIVFPKDIENITPLQLSKHQTKMIEILGQPVVFAIEKIASYNISRLIKGNVNFIVPNKIVFIPDIMFVLRERKTEIKKVSEEMPPVAQLIVLYNIHVSSLSGKSILEIAEYVQMAYPTVNVALHWLANNNIIDLNGAKQKEVKFLYEGKDLWEKSLPLMTSPIERIIYSDIMVEDCVYAGETAMGYYTMLAEPTMPTIAINKKCAKDNSGTFDKNFGDYKVEVWKYSPRILSNNEYVDPLSLYLSLKDNKDERVQIECDNLIKEIKW